MTAFEEIYMQKDYHPPDGTNLLTEQLKAAGCDPKDSSTWPEGVYSGDGEHFLYKWDWKYSKVWQAPCGLQTKGHGWSWGDIHAEGRYFCDENDNPLFQCPFPGRQCEHRKKDFPPGINCEFHHVPDALYDEEKEIRTIEKERYAKLATVREKDLKDHPGYEQPCMGMKVDFGPDGEERIRYVWRLSNCMSCRNTICPARGWKPRDIRKANIFYDLYMEKTEEIGMASFTEKTMRKGIALFDKAIPWTDAEFALAIWKRNPDSPILPAGMAYKMQNFARPGMGRTEDYFLTHHGEYDGKRYTLHTEIRNLRVAKMDQKDMLADLQAIRDGIEVIHDSDLKKAAKQQKSDQKAQAVIDRKARKIAKGQGRLTLWEYAVNAKDSDHVRKKKQETLSAIKARADEIRKKTEEKEKAKKQIGGQMDMLTMLDGGGP